MAHGPKAGSRWVVAGGMESMTGAPYPLPQARGGLRMGHMAYDTMFLDGLEDAYTGRAMGSFAQETADAHQLTRDAMDRYAIQSRERARAQQCGFDAEIVPLTFDTRGGPVTITEDEQPLRGKPEKIPTLKPAFSRRHHYRGQLELNLMARRRCATTAGKRKPPASPPWRIVAHAPRQTPNLYHGTSAPLKALLSARLDLASVDLFEINEAFAMVAMLAIDGLGLDEGRSTSNVAPAPATHRGPGHASCSAHALAAPEARGV